MTTPSRYPTVEEVRGVIATGPLVFLETNRAMVEAAINIERERVAKEAGECSVAGLADDLRLVAQLESKRMGAMSSGLLKGVIGRLSALPPPPAEGSPA